MMACFLKTRTQDASKDIHPYVFKSFLCMQLSNHIAVIFDYIVCRVPSTSLVTSYFSSHLQIFADFIFSAIVTICIVVMTSMMLMKMRNLKLIDQNSKLKSKAETTLKITMCVILIPSMIIFAVRDLLQPNTTKYCLQITGFSATKYASYIILIRPILLDCRVNIVSCYFYMSHPYFKRKETPKSVHLTPWRTN
ncbi:hypothetical protein GCK72_020577 [Caenorhabditis remanei]|uniref:Uncharacterized protein n=1 Tax=Caenorhabditis remanei TaxID=31234 RepID=A0A6A5GHV2_CAERE|nr:hypothetical protein GCK72_020577 [Caenorhabditis remanei]KAF1754019.1 hypothetical protein GCK72_020577 [Caenorhabditis remanei]